ncbi:hypothetical protein DIPPA_22815 [Diplonema papillatum]|nr:hypothetical protein DIPPA_22815 [Diplonema papillatum]
MPLLIDGQPSKVASGEAFTVVVLLMTDDGDQDIERSDAVELHVRDGEGSLQGTCTVAAEEGEATFSNVRYNGAEPFTLVATSAGAESEASDVIAVDGVGGCAADEPQDDDTLTDAPRLLWKASLPTTSAGQAKHLLTLLKGRLWNSDGNREKYREMRAHDQLAGLLDRFDDDVDAAIVVLAILKDLMTFSGSVRYTCSSSHAPITTSFVQTTADGASKNWLPSCFLDAKTKSPIFDPWPPVDRDAMHYEHHDHQPYKLGNGPAGSAKARATFMPAPPSSPGGRNACFITPAVLPPVLKLFRKHSGDAYLVEKLRAVVQPVLAMHPDKKASLPPGLVS